MKKKSMFLAVLISLCLAVPGFSVYAQDLRLSRLEFISDVFREVISDYNGSIAHFPDVSADYAHIVAAAVHFRIANGHDDGTFRPHDIVTSEQAVAMTVKYLGQRDHALSLPVEALDGLDLPFWITPYYKWMRTYHSEYMPLFIIGSPASAELVEMLRDIVNSHRPTATRAGFQIGF